MSKKSGTPERTWASKSVGEGLTHEGMLKLIEWFEGFTPPTEPFQLNSNSKVVDPEKFFHNIRLAIAQGPSGPRARYGAIQQDLWNLYQLFKDEPAKAKVEFEIGEEDTEDM